MIGARQAISLSLSTAALAVIASGCGSQGVEVNSRGAQLFAERCSGCHTLKAAGSRGSILGERPTGPNLDKRKLSKPEVLFAIRNGGFSGAIMPQNIVLGKDADEVAAFVSKYAGAGAKGSPAPQPSSGATGGGATGTTSVASKSGGKSSSTQKSAGSQKKKKGNR